MGRISLKRFTTPDETRRFPNGQAQLLRIGTDVVGLGTFEKGWKWSKDVMPIAGTKSCEAAHNCYVLSGKMRVVMDDGEAVELSAGDFANIPPGHDAWVLGDETCRMVDFTGLEHYAQPGVAATQRPEAGRPEVRRH